MFILNPKPRNVGIEQLITLGARRESKISFCGDRKAAARSEGFGRNFKSGRRLLALVLVAIHHANDAFAPARRSKLCSAAICSAVCRSST